jgi:hypothetical protein
MGNLTSASYSTVWPPVSDLHVMPRKRCRRQRLVEKGMFCVLSHSVDLHAVICCVSVFSLFFALILLAQLQISSTLTIDSVSQSIVASYLPVKSATSTMMRLTVVRLNYYDDGHYRSMFDESCFTIVRTPFHRHKEELYHNPRSPLRC